MTVEQVNGAQTQAPKKNYTTAALATAGLGAVGATGGYFLGGSRPTLEEIFKQKPDAFTASEVTAADSEAATKLAAAQTEYKAAGAAEKAELRTAAEALRDEIKNATPDNLADLNQKVTDAKTAYNAKEIEVTLADGSKVKKKATDIAKDLKDAKAKLAAATDDAAKEAAKKELDAARANVKTFREQAKKEIGDLGTAQKNLHNAKKAKFDELAKVDGSNEKKLVDAVAEKSNNFKNAMKTKMDEILGRDEIKQAFEKVKKAFPKEGKGKAALIYGGIAAAVGLVVGIFFAGKKEA